jgi:hypothetical protein
LPEIHNPNLQSQGSGGGGGGGDMRSTMAFMLVVLAAFLGYQYFFNKPKPQEQPPAHPQRSPLPRFAAPAAPGPAQSLPRATSPQRHAANRASIETVTTVENELFKIVSPIAARRSSIGS